MVTENTSEHGVMVNDCMKRLAKLNAWEIDFIRSLHRQINSFKDLSESQIEKLDTVWEKATANG